MLQAEKMLIPTLTTAQSLGNASAAEVFADRKWQSSNKKQQKALLNPVLIILVLFQTSFDPGLLQIISATPWGS